VAGGLLASADAARLLEAGGVVILGTDTLPGLHCRADLAEPVRRILELKGREPHQRLLVLAGSAAQAARVTGILDDRQTDYCTRCWPGPFSLILPSGGTLCPLVNAGGGSVAVRVPGLASLRELILATDFPLVSTSANFSGEPPCADLDAARSVFGDRVDGYWQPLESPLGPPGIGRPLPSALIDLTVWPFLQLRPGPLEPPGGTGGLDGDTPGV
jgi:L-threonylcarbamoyladenylate synthase